MEQLSGLTEQEVQQRRAQMPPQDDMRMTKSVSQIVRTNLVTLFNVLNFIIAILLFAVGAYSNMLFIAIIILNIVIGTAQELKAKKLVDELSILNRPTVRVRREGQDKRIPMEEVVPGDVMHLKSGDQICCDGTVIAGSLEANESLLTGESDGIVKEKGSELYSGSAVIAGAAFAEVTHTGSESYASKLAAEVKKEKQVDSELLGSMKKVTRFTSFLIIPLGIILFVEALLLRDAAIDTAVVTSAAALLGMLPKGLVLLISVSLAAGVIRLAKMKILVQNIYSLETLAHVDVLCLDKTGTITDGQLKVIKKLPMTELPKAEVDALIQAYLAASDDTNATFNALVDAFGTKQRYATACKIPFSSKRKWGCVSFKDIGSIFVGAPDRLLPEMPQAIAKVMDQGMRVIVIGYSGEVWDDPEALPSAMQPLYTVILEDTLRPNTQETLECFRKEGIDVKIISGDHVKTVSAIAKRAGLVRWKNAIDLSTVGEDADYDALCEQYAVFARVTPNQKRELVKALQRRGHQVAMTGDGVNDLLALREADCSIAVADGSDASRQISQVVLLDSDFTNLPQVLMEGRRVINNVTRTAGVFFIKTIYSVLTAVFCMLMNVPFPFIPIQITLVDACIEAYPSFLTIMEADTRKIRGRFLNQALLNAAPFALAVTGMIITISLMAPFADGQRQTVMYLLLVMISMCAVIRSCIPFNKLRAFICITMVGGTFLAMYLFPTLLEITAVTGQMAGFAAIAFVIALIAVLVLWLVRRKVDNRFNGETMRPNRL